MGVEPTKDTESTSGWVRSVSTGSLSPCTTETTPAGRPASAQRSAIQIAALGSFSLGLRITALPAAIAMGTNHSGTIAGKLNGEITTATPSGWRTECTSTLVEAFSVNMPLSRCGMPHANSTTSCPRCTSPSASECTLPCSAVMIAASSSLRELSSSRKAKSTSVRFARDASRHAGNAARAEAMTAETSSALARGTSPVTWPVAGFVTGAERPSPSRAAPSIQCGTRVLIDAPETGAAPLRRDWIESRTRRHSMGTQRPSDSPATSWFLHEFVHPDGRTRAEAPNSAGGGGAARMGPMSSSPNLAERIPADPDPDSLFEAFTGWAADQGLELYPAQEEAVLGLVTGAHVILSTPTGSGKSLVATAAHFIALAQGRRTYYTAPLKALVSEKFFALVDAFGAENVGMMTGDSAVN